jgi:hypothetical protein
LSESEVVVALRRKGPATGTEVFPGFADVTEIGTGSLATVYRAREIDTNRHVALKLLNVRDASPRAIESFQRESMALGALSAHPNIVTLFRTFPIPDGRPVLVLELCTAAVSDRLLGGTRLPVQEAVSIAIKIASALETAHRAGILHRDVKPQNMLVTEFGEPALADFGVAMLQSSTQTTAGLFDFTTLHAAPELLEGGATSAATDVYELASTLYQLIAGESAFRSYDGESPASVILRILRDPVRPVVAAGVPVALSDLLIWAMSKDKDHRPPTAAEFAVELSQVEVEQGWPRTQFLIRDSGAGVAGGLPTITRLPDRPSIVPPWPAPALDPARPWIVSAPPTPAPAVTGPPAAPAAYPLRPPRPPPAAPPLIEFVPAASAPPPATADVDYPVPPVAFRGAPDQSGALGEPAAALRVARPAARVPQFVGDLVIDPMSLRRRLRLHAGLTALTIDDRCLTLRIRATRTRIPWTDVLGFEPRNEAGDDQAAPRGSLVVLTTLGPVELPATRGSLAEVRDAHAMLDAYRIRAQMAQNY